MLDDVNQREATRAVASTLASLRATIDDFAAGLKSGAISPDQLPLNPITRDGVTSHYDAEGRNRAGGAQRRKGDAIFEGQLTTLLDELAGSVADDAMPVIRGCK